MRRAVGFAVLAFSLAACASGPNPDNIVRMPLIGEPAAEGDLTVDGRPFSAMTCKSGRAEGFNGADLSDDEGTRLRLVSELDGASTIIVFRRGAARGITLRECSRVEIVHSGSARYPQMRGRASIRCQGEGVRVSGRVAFLSCG